MCQKINARVVAQFRENSPLCQRGVSQHPAGIWRRSLGRGAAEHVEAVTDTAITELTAANISTVQACAALGRPRATHYRRHSVTPKRRCWGRPRRDDDNLVR